MIGPGLGRGDENIGLMKNILHKAKENKDLRLVIDAVSFCDFWYICFLGILGRHFLA